jgi:hypothetical protein
MRALLGKARKRLDPKVDVNGIKCQLSSCADAEATHMFRVNDGAEHFVCDVCLEKVRWMAGLFRDRLLVRRLEAFGEPEVAEPPAKGEP